MVTLLFSRILKANVNLIYWVKKNSSNLIFFLKKLWKENIYIYRDNPIIKRPKKKKKKTSKAKLAGMLIMFATTR